MNPVFRREAKTSLRSWRSFVAVSLYVLASFGVIILALAVGGMGGGGSNPRNISQMSGVMAGFKLALIGLIVPAICAGSINGERERQTLDLMLITKMSPWSIVFGKLLSSLIFIVLLLVAGLPVFGIMFYYGSFSPLHMAVQTSFMLITASMVASIAILCSCIFRRVVFSIITSYLLLILFTIGTLIFVNVMFGVLQSIHWTNTQDSLIFVPFVLSQAWQNTFLVMLSLNPIAGFTSLIDSQMGSESFRILLPHGLNNLNTWGSLELWQLSMITNGAISAICMALAAYAIKPIKGVNYGKQGKRAGKGSASA